MLMLVALTNHKSQEIKTSVIQDYFRNSWKLLYSQQDSLVYAAILDITNSSVRKGRERS